MTGVQASLYLCRSLILNVLVEKREILLAVMAVLICWPMLLPNLKVSEYCGTALSVVTPSNKEYAMTQGTDSLDRMHRTYPVSGRLGASYS